MTSEHRPLRQQDLRADCANCAALCCVVLTLDKSRDFAFNKPAGTPCPNLADLRCSIHAELRPRGFAGCAAYDCQGAGQKVTQHTFGGLDLRLDPAAAQRAVTIFPIVRQLHEILAFLVAAREVPAAALFRDEIETEIETIDELTHLGPVELTELDVSALRGRVGPLLTRVSQEARRPQPGADRRGADLAEKHLAGKDLAGKNLRGADLARADLRGAYLMAADLRGADLSLADLLGADLRDTDLRGANLTDCLFLTSAQLHGACGDATTRLSPGIARPVHWV